MSESESEPEGAADRETTADPGYEPDFAEEHTRPTFADEPSTEDPDESVPSGRGGDGGMDIGQRIMPD